MKFCIFVCIFVVVACHEAFCESPIDFPAKVEGNCKSGIIGESDRNQCQHVLCKEDKNGGVSLSTLGCSLSICPDGKELGHGPHDLTKKYPDCCRPDTCD